MTKIKIEKVNVEYPLFSIENHSLRHRVISSVTGGKLSKSAKNLNVIKALNNINLEILSGERVCLIGHNGSGKSTFLRLIAGIYPPVTGKVTVDGNVSSLIDPALGMDYEASGIENIYLKGYLLGKSKVEIESIIRDVIDFSELGDFINLPVRTYSSGMVMRLAFSISTSISPEILLLDEWLSVGDTDFRSKATVRLNNFIGGVDILLLATNDEALAKSLATRIIKFEHGAIIDDYKL